MAEEFVEESSPGKRPYARTLFALQVLLVLCVTGWVLDLQRSLLGLNLYTEQLLLAVLGLALAICFLVTRKRPAWWDLAAAFGGLALCLYLAWAYPVLSDRLTMRPLDGILMSAALALLVLEGTRRMAGFSLVGFTLAGVVYAMLGHHLPGVFQARPVEFTRLLVYLNLDTNALLGTSLQIGVLRHDLGQRGGERVGGGRGHHSAHEALGFSGADRRGDRGGGLDRRPAHAAGDGRGGVPHGR